MLGKSKQSDAAAEPLPDSIGPYRVDSQLGEGGMGVVYKATAPDGSPVAVKLVKGNMASDPTFRRRFEREARFAEGVSHPNVVSVVDTGAHDGVPYIVQQFVDGESLEEKVQREGPLDAQTLVAVCKGIAGALDAIHEAGITHRDLKPANVMVAADGSIHITDFGLAKQEGASMLTMPGQVLGSMDYMAPEQIRGADVNAITDLYAFGCLVFFCVSGDAPFADRHGMKILYAHLQDAPNDPCAGRDDLPDGLGAAILAAMAKEPADRPQTAAEYAQIIEAAAFPTPA
jgi:serine/threonine-protein kinase